ncbi:MAG TPA: chemotaxis protein CheW [Acidimicrobiales bacterium]|nr:chemotaxis protein CheW [Acidimicrobiales bacterium]
MSAVERCCTFRLADLYIGIEVMRVQEVLRAQDTTPVPLTTPVVGGLMNLRGEIVTTVDLRCRLGLAPADPGSEPMNVVIRSADGVVSLLVDAIEDVIEVDEGDLEAPPATLPERLRELVVGVYTLEGELLLLLDAERVGAVPAADVQATVPA